MEIFQSYSRIDLPFNVSLILWLCIVNSRNYHQLAMDLFLWEMSKIQNICNNRIIKHYCCIYTVVPRLASLNTDAIFIYISSTLCHFVSIKLISKASQTSGKKWIIWHQFKFAKINFQLSIFMENLHLKPITFPRSTYIWKWHWTNKTITIT